MGMNILHHYIKEVLLQMMLFFLWNQWRITLCSNVMKMLLLLYIILGKTIHDN
jgi:hypothetical protein